jgi:hypothetical protein
LETLHLLLTMLLYKQKGLITIMFKENKYTRWYFDIIKKRQLNPITDGTYTEKHHIIPKSMGGGEGTNLVALTGREHYDCHALLVRMTEGSHRESMIVAFNYMHSSSKDHDGNRHFNSKLYEANRIEFAKVQSKRQSGKNNSQAGTKWITDMENMVIKKVGKDYTNGIYEFDGRFRKFIDLDWDLNYCRELFDTYLNQHNSLSKFLSDLWGGSITTTNLPRMRHVWECILPLDVVNSAIRSKRKNANNMETNEEILNKSVKLFKLYKNGNYSSLLAFHRYITCEGIYTHSNQALYNLFLTHIPEYVEYAKLRKGTRTKRDFTKSKP